MREKKVSGDYSFGILLVNLICDLFYWINRLIPGVKSYIDAEKRKVSSLVQFLLDLDFAFG